jgi:hypothetical protein
MVEAIQRSALREVIVFELPPGAHCALVLVQATTLAPQRSA